jgi:hypothetical protein
MSEAKDNLLWGPIENLKTLIASSKSFQALCGIGFGLAPFGQGGFGDDAAVTTAKTHVYCPAIHRVDIAAARPLAIIIGSTDWHGRRKGAGAYGYGGKIALALEATVPEEHAGEETAKYAAAEEWFVSLVGDIVGEMCEIAELDGYLSLTGVKVEMAQRTDPANVKSEGDIYRVVLSLDWGVA